MSVLATTDGSEESLAILPHASRLSAAIGEELILLRVLDPLIDARSVVAPSLQQAVSQVSAQWEKELEGILATRGIAGAGHVAARVHGEETHDTVHHAAERLEASVIATHSHAGGKLRRAFLGSNTMAMLAKRGVPLLASGPAVAAPVDGSRYHVFFTTDGSPAAESALASFQPLLHEAGAHVTLWQALVAAGAPQDEDAAGARLEILSGQLPSGVTSEIRVAPAVAPGEVASLLVREAVACGATAIGMSTHGHSARYHLVAGSVAIAVLGQSPLPVLLARASSS